MNRTVKQVVRGANLAKAANMVLSGTDPIDAIDAVAGKLAAIPGRKPAKSRSNVLEFAAHMDAFFKWYAAGSSGSDTPEVVKAAKLIRRVEWPTGGNDDGDLAAALEALSAEIGD